MGGIALSAPRNCKKVSRSTLCFSPMPNQWRSRWPSIGFPRLASFSPYFRNWQGVSSVIRLRKEKIVPFGPPPRFDEVLSHAGAKVLVCKPCAMVRYLSEANLDKRVTLAGMNEFHAAAARENARVVCF